MRTALLVAALFTPIYASAESLTLNKTIYGAGETGTYTVEMNPKQNYRVEFRHRFTWEPGRNRGARIGWSTGKTSETRKFVAGTHDRAAYDVVLLKENAGTLTEVARTLFYVLGKKPNPVVSKIVWPKDTTDVLTALEAEFGIDEPAGLTNVYRPRLEIVRLGRVHPGGAVEPDQIVRSQGLEVSPPHHLKLKREDTTHAMLFAGNHVTVLDNNTAALGGMLNIRKPDSPVKAGGGVAVNRRLSFRSSTLSTLPIGEYALRVIGAHDTLLGERLWRRFPPKQPDAIQLSPAFKDSPLTDIPAVTINLRDLSLNEVQATFALVSRQGTQLASGGSRVAIRASAVGNEVNVPGVLQSGRYRVSLYYSPWRNQSNTQMILLDRQEFDYQQPAKQRVVFPAPIDPPLEIADVDIQLENSRVPILGPDIKLVVRDLKNKPLATGPLVAETYRRGHFTYGCFWAEGSYTGAAGLVDSTGRAQIAAPAVAGSHEIRLFRPMDDMPMGDNSEPKHLRVTRTFPGETAHPGNMELVGIANSMRLPQPPTKYCKPPSLDWLSRCMW